MALPLPAAVPVEGGRLLSRQGPRPSRRTWHHGIDLGADTGTPCRSIAAGTVEFVRACGYDCSYGNTVVVRHDGETLSVYAHLDEIRVAEGQGVDAGELIGTVGNTTNLRAGMVPHLHLEIVRSWPLSPRDMAARYDVLGELAAAGVLLEGLELHLGTPAHYEEPMLAAQYKAASRAGEWRIIVAPEELSSPAPRDRTGLVVGILCVLAATGIFVATAWFLPGGRRSHGGIARPPDDPRLMPPPSCSPWRSVLTGAAMGRQEIESVCSHAGRVMRRARVWVDDGQYVVRIEDADGRQLSTNRFDRAWTARRWAEWRLRSDV